MNDHRQQFNLDDAVTIRTDLGIFTSEQPRNDLAMSAFSRYLHFYQLPLQTDKISINAGTTEDGEIVIVAWRPLKSRGTAIIVHGYMDHIGLYRHLIQELLNRQLTVLCFDAKGHGLSAGEACSISDFSEYVDRLNEIITMAKGHFKGPLHGIGQSMGGAVLIKHLINYKTTTPYPFSSLNLFSPLLHPWGWKQSRHLYYLSRWFIKSIKRVFRSSSWDEDFLDFLRHQDPLQPTKVPTDWVGAMNQWILEFERSDDNDYPINIIQGDHDKTLDWSYNLEQFKDKFPAASVVVIGNVNHHMVNELESLRKQIFAALRL